jgi:hypothetical protein
MKRSRTVAALVAAFVLVPAGHAAAKGGGHSGSDRQLREYAKTTWASLAAMTDAKSGMPADVLNADGTRSVQTSTTNIGAYLWSAVVAERLGFIRRPELVRRLERTLASVEKLERPANSGGQFYNWYDHRTGAKITVWPPSGDPIVPHLSSVDNGWLAVGLKIVENAVPQLSRRAGALYDSMDFGFYYKPERNQLLFHYAPDTGAAPCCYDTTVSESRISTYLGIANGQVPPKAYYGTNRTFAPDACFQETKPVGQYRTYLGVNVFEGAYPYAGMLVTPSWGGSMFEALMPDLFVPEEQWAPRSWGVNHPLTVRAQIHHGMTEAGYGYWGFSPSNVPEGGYAVYGVDGIGMDPNGNPSNNDKTLIDHGFPGCPDRPAKPDPAPSEYTNGVVTPHAAFLGLRYAPEATLSNLSKLAKDFPGMYGKWGFRDAVNVDTGHVSGAYLSLDQGMIMAALGNALDRDVLRRAFADRAFERGVRPVIGIEEFGARASAG